MILSAPTDTAPPPEIAALPASTERVHHYGGWRIFEGHRSFRVVDPKGRLVAQAVSLEAAEFALAENLA